MMLQPHWSCEVLSWMWIDWLDLPKLTTLRTTTEKNEYGYYSFSFLYPRHITLESDSHSLWMMFRHAQSHKCVFHQWSIQVQEWRHNHRQYSLHLSLTNRHRSSSQLLLITERHVTSLCATHNHNTHFHPPQSSFSGIRESVIAVRTRK